MGSFKHRLQETIVTQSLFNKDDVLLVSFSGGSDSVALVHALVALGYKRLKLIYFDHGLRSKIEIETEKIFVAEFAKQCQVSYRIMALPISFISDQYGVSLESAGHEARYYCLERFAGIYGAKAVLMAHHQDDLLETLLLQLDRGSVFHMGMPLKQRVGSICFVRPLLGQLKQDIILYCDDETVSYCVDSSNSNVSFRRNQLRHDVLPVLSTFSSSFDRHLNSLFQRVQKSYETSEFKRLLASCKVVEHPYYFECIFSDSVKKSDFYLTTIIYQVLKHCFESGLRQRLKDRLASHFDCNMTQLDCLKEAVMGQKSGELIHLKKGVSVYCYHQHLYIAKLNSNLAQQQSLVLDHVIEWGGYRVRFEQCEHLPDSCLSSKTQCYVSLPEPVLKVGILNKEDTYMPFNHHSFVTVHKALVKKGIQAFFREFCVGFRYNNELVWVPELGVDNRFRVSSESSTCYKLSLDYLKGDK
tara:strand:- start:250 stop:1662 length:1413 start_codon:yes stop_codon:yes gene_type:complete